MVFSYVGVGAKRRVRRRRSRRNAHDRTQSSKEETYIVNSRSRFDRSTYISIYGTYQHLTFSIWSVSSVIPVMPFRNVREGTGSIPGVGAKRRREDGEAV